VKNNVFMGCMASFAISISLSSGPVSAQTLTLLHTFTGGADGEFPAQGLVRDEHGNLYGTTNGGPLPPPFTSIGGTVFKVDRSGRLVTLYTFTGPNGANPSRGHLLQDDEGNLYGLTGNGGTLPGGGPGRGILYRLNAHGEQTVLHVFGGGTDGVSPTGTLYRDRLGNFYGTTAGGGAFGFGTAFKLSNSGEETVLHSFNIGVDGWLPSGGLVADEAGNLYGVTSFGGPAATDLGEVFKIDNAGGYTVLHAFSGSPDGSVPGGELVLDGEGNLYGTTSSGGAFGSGTVFKVDRSGKYTILHNFSATSPYGGALIRDRAGNFFGTTTTGVFEMDPTGNVTVLVTFPPSVSQGVPISPLVRDRAGNLYGATTGVAALNPTVFGAVFKVTP
jgi:uncharacterized repeat protein (TIGR03803 family)